MGGLATMGAATVVVIVWMKVDGYLQMKELDRENVRVLMARVYNLEVQASRRKGSPRD